MKLAQILLACVTSCLITTSVSAQGFCVAENEGCRDIQTGKLYVPDGNKLVDPETKQVYLENQEVRSSVVSSGVGETSKTPSGGAFKGGVFDPSGTDALYAERAAKRRELDVNGGISEPNKQVKIHESERITGITSSGDYVLGSRSYARTTTCQELKREIDELNQSGAKHHSVNRLEKAYREQCG